KTRCLTAWPRPRASPTLTTIREDVEERADREDRHQDDRRPQDDEGEDGGQRGEQLRDREDPRGLVERVRPRAAARIEIREDGDDRQREDREARNVVEDRDED